MLSGDNERLPMQGLGCSYNQLTSATLNTLFGTLSTNGGTIPINNNPGTKSCNRSIAEEWGWKVLK